MLFLFDEFKLYFDTFFCEYCIINFTYGDSSLIYSPECMNGSRIMLELTKDAVCEPCPVNQYQKNNSFETDMNICRDCPDGYSTKGLTGQIQCDREFPLSAKFVAA